MRQSRFLVVFIACNLAGCITSRIEDARENVTGLNDGQSESGPCHSFIIREHHTRPEMAPS